MYDSTPMFINFAPHETPAQTESLPNGGATIGVVAGDEMPGAESSPKWLRSPRDFLADDLRAEAPSPAPSIAPVEFPPEAEVSGAVMTSYEPAYVFT